MMSVRRIRVGILGLAVAGVLAFSAQAQAVTLDAGVFTTGSGDAANPVVFNVTAGSGLFLDTINFDLGAFTHFNMASTATNITAFGAPIFENVGDTEVVPAAPTHVSVFLPDLGLDRDYHLHPQGLNNGGGAYQVSLWGSTAAVPLPAAMWLFGSGVIGLAGLARRRMQAMA